MKCPIDLVLSGDSSYEINRMSGKRSHFLGFTAVRYIVLIRRLWSMAAHANLSQSLDQFVSKVVGRSARLLRSLHTGSGFPLLANDAHAGAAGWMHFRGGQRSLATGEIVSGIEGLAAPNC
jgi:hypothetical protein